MAMFNWQSMDNLKMVVHDTQTVKTNLVILEQLGLKNPRYTGEAKFDWLAAAIGLLQIEVGLKKELTRVAAYLTTG